MNREVKSDVKGAKYIDKSISETIIKVVMELLALLLVFSVHIVLGDEFEVKLDADSTEPDSPRYGLISTEHFLRNVDRIHLISILKDLYFPPPLTR